VVIVVTLIVFLILHLLPGGPARALLGPRASAAQVHAFIVANGYNRPVFVQYWHYLVRITQGNLGFSYHYNETVIALLKQNLPKSAILVGIAIALALCIALPLGLLQAQHRNRVGDHVVTTAALTGYSMPTFWLGLILIQVFAISLRFFPPEAPQGVTVGAILSQPKALILPVATLTIVTTALFSRFMRSSAIEALVQDYVRTARAEGVSPRRILWEHVFRNSVLPIITLVGINIPGIIGGALLVEVVFNFPGMGLLFWNAVTVHDYPVIMGFTLVIGVATVLGNLLADILYAVADPRVRY
jgi:peptide/nickel transport system permease protein